MAQTNPIPLCIDLDGTLISSDTLCEASLELIKRRPATAMWMPLWLMRGKANLKARVAERVVLNAESLPYREEFMAWARLESTIRPVVLVTAAHRLVAEGVARHLGFFSQVFATDGVNLKADNKARVLVQCFGERGFDYAGNGTADLAVWKHAREAVVVGATRQLALAARNATNVTREFDPGPSLLTRAKLWAKALRLYQWVKNLLIFLAPAAAHMLLQPLVFRATLLAFLSFGLAASGIYLINDLLDLSSDRRHPRKRLRPFACGALSLSAGAIAAPLLVGAGIAIGASVNSLFLVVLFVYLAVTMTYMVWLKRKAFIDVGALATLYTLRVVAGAAAIGIGLSFWLLAVCVYGFLGLALLKRYAELRVIQEEGQSAVAGRGYLTSDLPVVLALGVGASLLTTLVMALYVDSPASRVLYGRPEVLWILIALMILGVGRLWLKAGRGEMHDDPIVFVAKDRWSGALLVISAIVVVVASL
jgi:4-hydroxybenzoate polyprenyltransferase